MSSARWYSPMWCLALLGSAALLGAGAANAQVAPSTSSLHAAPVSATESSSTEWALANSDGSDALPAAPEPANGAAGQYDNKGGGGNTGWSGKLAIVAGGGFDMPVSDTSNYVNSGFDIDLGGGMHFSRAFSALIEYHFIGDGLPSKIVAEAGSNGGNVHLWSLGLDGVYDILPKAANGVYVTGGAGFYRKRTNFTNVTQGQYCYYFYCGVQNQNQTVGSFSSNQAGIDVGGGFRHKFTGMYGDGRMEIFAEVRYIEAFTPAILGKSANGLGNTTIGADTKLLPINFGLRF